jgi:hypothetical protein
MKLPTTGQPRAEPKGIGGDDARHAIDHVDLVESKLRIATLRSG